MGIDFDNMPREDLIEELKAWRNKFESKVSDEVEKRVAKKHKDYNKAIKILKSNIKDKSLKEVINLLKEAEKIFFGVDIRYNYFFFREEVNVDDMPFDIKYHYSKLKNLLELERY